MCLRAQYLLNGEIYETRWVHRSPLWLLKWSCKDIKKSSFQRRFVVDTFVIAKRRHYNHYIIVERGHILWQDVSTRGPCVEMTNDNIPADQWLMFSAQLDVSGGKMVIRGPANEDKA